MLGQAPDRPYDGSMIPQTSVPGRAVDFVQPTNTSTASVSLAATGGADVGSFEVALVVTENGKVVQWDKIVAWCYTIFYVDTENVGKVWREGGTLTSGQTKIEMGTKSLLFVLGATPSIYSHITYYSFRNFDASAHSIIGYFKWKYITTA